MFNHAPEGKMNALSDFEKAGLAAVLIALAGGCAHKLADQVASEEWSAVPGIVQPSLASTEAREISHSAGQVISKAPGLVVHIDPLTGEILPKPPVPPAGQILDPQQYQSAPAPAPQAVEVPSPVPGGGVKVNLNRQFHQPLFATMDADGRIRLEHRPAQTLNVEGK
jgi:hypothetical protein